MQLQLHFVKFNPTVTAMDSGVVELFFKKNDIEVVSWLYNLEGINYESFTIKFDATKGEILNKDEAVKIQSLDYTAGGMVKQTLTINELLKISDIKRCAMETSDNFFGQSVVRLNDETVEIVDELERLNKERARDKAIDEALANYDREMFMQLTNEFVEGRQCEESI